MSTSIVEAAGRRPSTCAIDLDLAFNMSTVRRHAEKSFSWSFFNSVYKTMATSPTSISKQRRSGGTNVNKTTRRAINQTPGDAVKSGRRGIGRGGSLIDQQKGERERLVLWRSPVRTIDYFIKELGITLSDATKRLWIRKWYVLLLIVAVSVTVSVCQLDGPHKQLVGLIRQKFVWCAYWVGLGVLSSVGLGTGLHTFLLYLGPHIASVTLAAYECESLRFPEPPYPDEIVCPDEKLTAVSAITLWSIMSKVRLEAFMWGAGTALGELPPYFMARAARISGLEDDDETLEEFEALLHEQQNNPSELSFMTRAKLSIERLVERVGFFGILACASIPNPLFDLAGITCGHFLVPFWTFFGATLIGKAIIKMHIQKLFVIIAFNESLVEKAVNLTERVPHVGKYLHAPFRDFLEKQKAKLHQRRNVAGASLAEGGGTSWLSAVFEKVIIVMVAFFIVSIVNSMAQRYHKRLCKPGSSKATKTSKSAKLITQSSMITRSKKLADD